MDIHHAMVVRNQPDRLYEALIQPRDLAVWMGAPTLAQPVVGSLIEFQFDQGHRILKMEIIALEVARLVRWRVIHPVWQIEATEQIITWMLIPLEGWPQDDDTYASVSYKWASFMVRLKIHMGDHREIATFLPNEAQDGIGNQ